MTNDSEGSGGKTPVGKTTIVGGRPPEGDVPLGTIPRTVELLLQKAAVDPEFRKELLAERGAAAQELGIVLDPAEAALLAAIPVEQLEAVISHTKVPDKLRTLLIAGAVTLAAVGICTMCVPSLGNRPHLPPAPPAPPAATSPATIQPNPPGDGPAVQPPPPTTSQPTSSPTRGIRPDTPPHKPG